MSTREWEERADAGDGQFAIACALESIASELKWLGTGDAATRMGAIEFLASHVGEKLEELTSAINLAVQLLPDRDDV